MNKLVIVESPNKVKSISKYIKELQKENRLDKEDKYEVESSVGHILELKKTWDPKVKEDLANFEKIVIRGKAAVIKGLKTKAKKADEVIIATDPDREGEAIADDLINKLEVEKTYSRVTFNEITKDSLEAAFKNATKLNVPMVNAQKARMLLDRVFGYKLSKWSKQKLWNATARSAGRVQSPTLKLVVEREFQIEGFVPEPFFKVEQVINKTLIASIVLKEDNVDGKSNLLNPKKYADYREKINGELTVIDIKISRKNISSKIPYKQSSVYRAASSKYGLSAAAARSSMQALFEKGFISYPRTDSTRYSQTFIKKAQKYIENRFGSNYVATSIKGTSSGSQDAHEALRITDPNNTPDKVASKLRSTTELNMYKLIYNHTLQTLMVPPVRESLSYKLDDNGVEFKLSSSKVIFDGYLILTGWEKIEELPVLEKGDVIKSDEINFIEGETKPKGRFNEGSLIEAMEEAGIGRPSTFSSTVSTLLTRGYVEKHGNALRATRMGKALVMTLILYFNKIVQEKYTSELEQTLDKVSGGDKDYLTVVENFWDKLKAELDLAIIKRKDKTINNEKEELESYSKEYSKLLIAFTEYVKVEKKDIEIDYESYTKNEFQNFLGPIVMPVFPKRGGYILIDGKVETFIKGENYKDLEKCPVCNKHEMIYRGGISKRNQIYWSKTCSGWPDVKCNFREFINKDSAIYPRLEEYYNKKVALFREEELKDIQEMTMEIDLNDLTRQILINGL